LAVTPNGHALAAWIEDGVVRVSDGDGATRTWTPALTISQRGASGDPAVALDPAGDAVVAWTQGTEAAAAFRPANGGWGEPVDLGSAAQSADPHVAIDDAGNAVAVWLAGTTLRSAAKLRTG